MESLDALRAEYERLGRLTLTLKPNSPEMQAAKAKKTAAHQRWNAAKVAPAPTGDPAPIAEVPIAIESIGPGTVIVTAEPVIATEGDPSPPSSSASTPPEQPTPTRPTRSNNRRGRSASRPTSGPSPT